VADFGDQTQYLIQTVSDHVTPAPTSQPQPPRGGGGSLSCSDGSSVAAAVVAAPLLPANVMDRWLWGPLPSAQEEALWLGEQLGSVPLIGACATKERAVALLKQAQCVHFATHVSWKLAALVLAPGQQESPARGGRRVTGGRPAGQAPCGGGGGGGGDANTQAHTNNNNSGSSSDGSSPERRGAAGGAASEDGDSVVSDGESVADSPPLQDFLLTAADILNLSLDVKLVVLRYGRQRPLTCRNLGPITCCHW